MKQWVFALFSAGLAGCVALITACSGNKPWTVDVEVEGLGTQNVKAFYYTENDGLSQLNTSALDGKFSLQGNATDYTIVDIYNNQYVLLGRVPVKNGQTIKAMLKLGNTADFTLKGNDPSRSISDFYATNKGLIAEGDSLKVNQLVADYVLRHNGDVASTVIMMNLYKGGPAQLLDSITEPRGAEWMYRSIYSAPVVTDSVLTEPIELWTEGDSIMTLRHDAEELIVVTGRMEDDLRRDMNNRLDSLARHRKPRLKIVEISLLADTVLWHTALGDSSFRHTRAWLPGGIASPRLRQLGIFSTPAYIMVDSTGRARKIDSLCL